MWCQHGKNTLKYRLLHYNRQSKFSCLSNTTKLKCLHVCMCICTLPAVATTYQQEIWKSREKNEYTENAEYVCCFCLDGFFSSFPKKRFKKHYCVEFNVDSETVHSYSRALRTASVVRLNENGLYTHHYLLSTPQPRITCALLYLALPRLLSVHIIITIIISRIRRLKS